MMAARLEGSQLPPPTLLSFVALFSEPWCDHRAGSDAVGVHLHGCTLVLGIRYGDYFHHFQQRRRE